MKTPLKILFVVNDPAFFLSHRLPFARALSSAGYEVHVATPAEEGWKQVQTEGFLFHPIPLVRHSTSIVKEIRTAFALFRLFRSLRPDLVHLVTIKPVIYGGIMARLAKVPAVVSAVSGLGYIFLSKGVRASLLRSLVKQIYRLALGHSNLRVIFQNPDDRDLFLKAGMVAKKATVLIKGSGVDIAQFTPAPEPEDVPVVVLAGRMLWDKGVGEFAEAASLLKKEGVKARFVLVGDSPAGNPAAVPQRQLHSWQDQGVIEWWGYRENMPEVFNQSHVVCLPSYREGLPKVLIEAAAGGRPIVATDVPGCREIVRNGENGLLVPARDGAALANALRVLIKDSDLRRRMGGRGREIVENEFFEEKVIEEALAVYRQLLGNAL